MFLAQTLRVAVLHAAAIVSAAPTGERIGKKQQRLLLLLLISITNQSSQLIFGVILKKIASSTSSASSACCAPLWVKPLAEERKLELWNVR